MTQEEHKLLSEARRKLSELVESVDRRVEQCRREIAQGAPKGTDLMFASREAALLQSAQWILGIL